MLLSLTRLKMADVDVDGFGSVSAIALTAFVGAVIVLLVFLCNFVKKGFEKSKADTHGTPSTLTSKTVISHAARTPECRTWRKLKMPNSLNPNPKPVRNSGVRHSVPPIPLYATDQRINDS